MLLAVKNLCLTGPSFQSEEDDVVHPAKRQRLRTVFRNEIKLAPNTISNYFKVIQKMGLAFTSDSSYYMKFPDSSKIQETVLAKVSTLSKYNAKSITKYNQG